MNYLTESDLGLIHSIVGSKLTMYKQMKVNEKELIDMLKKCLKNIKKEINSLRKK